MLTGMKKGGRKNAVDTSLFPEARWLSALAGAKWDEIAKKARGKRRGGGGGGGRGDCDMKLEIQERRNGCRSATTVWTSGGRALALLIVLSSSVCDGLECQLKCPAALVYTVRQGQTTTDIQRLFGVGQSSIIRNLADPVGGWPGGSRFEPNVTLLIPIKECICDPNFPTRMITYFNYNVEPEDTLVKIEEQYGGLTTVADLRTQTADKTDSLFAGHPQRVPVPCACREFLRNLDDPNNNFVSIVTFPAKGVASFTLEKTISTLNSTLEAIRAANPVAGRPFSLSQDLNRVLYIPSTSSLNDDRRQQNIGLLAHIFNDLPLSIISFNPSDPSQMEPVTLERTLAPTVIWTSCTEDVRDFLAQHDPTEWNFLDLDDVSPNNSDLEDFWTTHRDNGEVPSDDDPESISLPDMPKEERKPRPSPQLMRTATEKKQRIGRFVVVYLDDILIFSKSMEEHLKHLEEVLTILKKTKLHLNLEKSSFGKDSVIYLGQSVNVRELRSFLGLASHYRKFVPRFSIVACPLSRLTSKNVPYSWNTACTNAFQALKDALVSYPVLRIANPKLTFVVTTDASQYGIGAELQQDDGDGLRPLEFYSKRMPGVKVATSTDMRELYALRMALDHWKHYLLGRHFKVFSDHETLKWIKEQTTLSPTLIRWFHEIDIFDFELRHKKGCYSRVADTLSRHPEYMTCVVKSYDLRKKLKEELVEQTTKELELSPILERLWADPSSQPDFHEYGRLIFRRYRNYDRLCVPNHEPLRTHFLDLAHGRSGHFGMAKTYANLLRQFDWPGMKGTAKSLWLSVKRGNGEKVNEHAGAGGGGGDIGGGGEAGGAGGRAGEGAAGGTGERAGEAAGEGAAGGDIGGGGEVGGAGGQAGEGAAGGTGERAAEAAGEGEAIGARAGEGGGGGVGGAAGERAEAGLWRDLCGGDGGAAAPRGDLPTMARLHRVMVRLAGGGDDGTAGCRRRRRSGCAEWRRGNGEKVNEHAGAGGGGGDIGGGGEAGGAGGRAGEGAAGGTGERAGEAAGEGAAGGDIGGGGEVGGAGGQAGEGAAGGTGERAAEAAGEGEAIGARAGEGGGGGVGGAAGERAEAGLWRDLCTSKAKLELWHCRYLKGEAGAMALQFGHRFGGGEPSLA
ncbi:hypothetical protein CBR_g88529 [Chara braunii]|uniref:Reverse transcriptase domain-containing protein n=1 Tax=Chara braunii TaxID=69332 RepID=A0A388KB15_CHABU|nr:hypothetical protein CBR_g88529 [Chara braunii]|eukprot:GBG67240.1 hypothetical protein CBR_g88529 [Chara braunii]